MKCEICDHQAAFWASIRGYDHFRCNDCKHLFVFPRPTQRELDLFYGDGRYYSLAETQRLRLRSDAAVRLTRLERLCSLFHLSRRLLDVGCASGVFLGEAVRKGWQVAGGERSDETASEARQDTGAIISVGVLEEITIPGAPFPVVTAWEVIEHAIDPRAFLGALVRHTQSGGLIALSTPLSDGLPARVMGQRFPMLIPPEHLSLFSRRSLMSLANEFGLKQVAYRSFSNLSATSLASGLSRLLFRQGLEECSIGKRLALKSLGGAMVWVPSAVDALGWGTEMELVFQRQ